MYENELKASKLTLLKKPQFGINSIFFTLQRQSNEITRLLETLYGWVGCCKEENGLAFSLLPQAI